MRKHLFISVVGAVFFGLSQLAAAAGGHSGGMGGHGPGGMSGNHMSSQGQANNNAQFNADSTRGLDRAQQRMSEQGAAHQKATTKVQKAKAKPKAAKPTKIDSITIKQ